MAKQTIYTVGGTVQAGGGVYLKRKADDELLELCRRGELAFILSSRQVGKSSLMTRTAEQLSKENIRSATIDLSSIGAKVTQDEWYLGMLNEIATQLNLKTDIFAWWDQYAGLGPPQRFFNFLRDVMLKEIKENVVVFFDEIDTTLSISFADDFFATVRATYNARSTAPDFRRLSFVLVGVATPSDLISDDKRTPFNIGQRVDLKDFTLEEAMPLAQGLGENAENVLEWILAWSGGHPYLTQRMCAHLAKSNGNVDEQAVAQAVETLFISEQGQQDNNLQFVRDMLVKRSPDPRGVMLAYRDIRSGKKIVDDERSIIKSHLKISGVVSRQGENLAPRNRIYERAFDPKWIKENTPSAVSRRIMLGSALVVAFALLIAGFFAFRDLTRTDEVRAAQFTSNFQAATDPTTRLENLAGLFELEGYSDQAKSLFNQLAQGQKMELFVPTDSPDITREQVIVVRGLYQSMSNTSEGNDLLQAMKQAVEQEEPPSDLYDEITAWLNGREELNAGNFYSAEASFRLAVDKNANNPAVYFDLANAHIGMENYAAALNDLTQMIQLDKSRDVDARLLIESDDLFAAYWAKHNEQANYVELADAIADRVLGVDISFYQDDPATSQQIDFQKMKENVDFVIIRAGQNIWADPDFKDNWQEAKLAGLARGAYWFYDSRADPESQAEFWVELLEGDFGELPLFLILEESYRGPYAGWKNWQLFLERLKQLIPAEKEIGIYTRYLYWQENAPNSSTEGSDLEYFHQYLLWTSQYEATEPSIPKPWLDNEWTFWQYTPSGDGNFYGVESLEVSLSFFNGGPEAFRNRFGIP